MADEEFDRLLREATDAMAKANSKPRGFLNELQSCELSVESPDRLVKLVADGSGQVKSVHLKPAVMDLSVDELERSLLSAIRAIRETSGYVARQLSKDYWGTSEGSERRGC